MAYEVDSETQIPTDDYELDGCPVLIELDGCPVLIAAGLYELDLVDPTAAERMLIEHLKLPGRTCCDQHGFSDKARVEVETGCTVEEIEEPYRLEPPVQGSLFAELAPKPMRVSTRVYRQEIA